MVPVGDPMNSDSEYSRVADHHFINGLGCRISVVGSLNIGCQYFPNFWQLFEQADRFLLAPLLTVVADNPIALAVVSDAEGYVF